MNNVTRYTNKENVNPQKLQGDQDVGSLTKAFGKLGLVESKGDTEPRLKRTTRCYNGNTLFAGGPEWRSVEKK